MNPKVSSSNQSLSQSGASVLVLGLHHPPELVDSAADLNRETGNAIQRIIDAEQFTGKESEAVTLYAPEGLSATRVILVGLGAKKDFCERTAYQAAGTAAKTIASQAVDKAAFVVPVDFVSAFVAGAMVGCVGQDLYRKEPKLHPCQELVFCQASADSVEEGEILGSSVNLTRELINRPANEIYPESFAARCDSLASEYGMGCEIWDLARLTKEKCGALLAVAQGSDFEPRLAILEHRGGAADQAPIALVGKGVTFDSGGLSLKPNDAMLDMKCDMSGGAAVVGAMTAIARLKLPINVIGLVGLAENMVSGSSFRLGDVLTARNGKTIEVLNTDAEGRLVLADVLNVAVSRKACQIIDLATLTGACMVALGYNHSGLMSNNDELLEQIRNASQQTGEKSWPLPMDDEFGEQIQSKVADIKNVGNGRWGGAITAAKFLEEFVDSTPWVHVDIAGPAFAESPSSHIDAGASGVFVRTLVRFVSEKAKANS